MGFEEFEDVNSIFEKAPKMCLKEFVNLSEKVTEILKHESGTVGNLRIRGRLVEAPAEGEAIVIGDLHGDFATLTEILENSNFVEKLSQGQNQLLIFLGDYGDRGEQSPEVYYVVMKLKEAYPMNVVLMRGNHEGPRDLLASPHDLPGFLERRFGDEWSTAHEKLRELWDQLYNGVLVEHRYVMLHGGVPAQAKSAEDLAYAQENHPAESILEEILWSDPEEDLTGTFPSPRGAGKLFGEDVTTKFMDMLNVRVLIRGHESSGEGYKINHHGKILTLFSRKGRPYHNRQAAYLQLDLARSVEDAHQLRDYLNFL